MHLPPSKLDLSINRFITGPNIEVSGGSSGVVLSPIEEGSGSCFFGLGLSEKRGAPKEFTGTNGSLPWPEVSAWAARAGADLAGAQYRDPQSGKLFYCARTLGLQAWEVPNEYWDTVKEDLQRNSLPALDAPAGDLLMHYDFAQRRYIPERKATFLFITRDGLQGLLRFTAQVTHKFAPSSLNFPAIATPQTGPDQTEDAGFTRGVKLDYKFIYVETDEIKAEAKARLEARASQDRERHRLKIAEQLAKYPHLSGTVFLPNGQPASNAAVLVPVLGESALLGDRAFEYENRSSVYRALSNGSFVVPHIPEVEVLYVAHENGFAEFNLKGVKSPVSVHLQPWGRLEGVVTLEGKPAANEKITLMRHSLIRPSGRLALSPNIYRTESDQNGGFVFEHVPPGDLRVCRMVENNYTAEQHVTVTADKPTIIKYGFDGQMLSGRLIASDSSTNLSFNRGRFTFRTKLEPPTPAGVDEHRWQQDYWQSAEGKRRLHEFHYFGVIVEPNGEFRVRDVPPGAYEFSGELRDGGANELPTAGRLVGRVKQEILVPAPPAGHQNDPLDIGEFLLHVVGRLTPGDEAPAFEVNTTDGSPFRMADVRGKYVLLDFWATWCAPCRAETPNLKKLYDAYGKDPRFVMLGLSLDKTVEALIGYAKAEGISWPQAFLGDWSKATLPASVGVEGIPAIFLIDPKGTIVATDLRGDEITKAVEAVLPKNK